MMRLHIRVQTDSRPPFDGERYWRWDVYRAVVLPEAILGAGDRAVIFAQGWTRTKRDALRLARLVRQEICR